MAKTEPRLIRKVRHRRVRKKIAGTALWPRLCVFRSLNHFYAQITDDCVSRTLVSAGTLNAEVRGDTKQMMKTEKAEHVGSLLARRALDKGIHKVVFDRAGYKYHGRVKAFAEAAKKAGLLF